MVMCVSLIHRRAYQTLLDSQKNIQEWQQSIYYIFTHASELPHLEISIQPSSPSPEEHSTHLTNFSLIAFTQKTEIYLKMI